MKGVRIIVLNFMIFITIYYRISTFKKVCAALQCMMTLVYSICFPLTVLQNKLFVEQLVNSQIVSSARPSTEVKVESNQKPTEQNVINLTDETSFNQMSVQTSRVSDDRFKTIENKTFIQIGEFNVVKRSYTIQIKSARPGTYLDQL